MAFFDTDPLTQVYRALRTYLLNDQYLKPLVKPKNFPDLTGQAEDPLLDEVQDANLPELVMSPSGAPAPFGRTNTELGLYQTYSIRVATGQVILNQKFFPTVFALFRAFRRLERGPAAQLLGLDFVQRCDQMDRNDAMKISDEDARGTAGWVALYQVQVRMMFTNQQLDI